MYVFLLSPSLFIFSSSEPKCPSAYLYLSLSTYLSSSLTAYTQNAPKHTHSRIHPFIHPSIHPSNHLSIQTEKQVEAIKQNLGGRGQQGEWYVSEVGTFLVDRKTRTKGFFNYER